MDLEALRTGPLEDASDPARIIASELMFAGRIWDIRRETIEFGGSTFAREFVAHTGAVTVLAIDEHERILMINQYRHPIGGRDWELPAGLLDVEGEPPLLAAQRELAEEADLVAAEWIPLTRFHTSPGGSNEIIHLFEARGLSPAPQVHDRTAEEAEIVTRWVGLDDALEAVLAGRLLNSPLIIAVLAAHARRR
jgi:8-oxo-dGTP pyrophosphatase MutT (NUDIX family)